MTATLGPTDHAKLSPSGAHRWMNCPGSVEAEAPFPDSSSKYADEGTAAHHYAAVCLEQGIDAEALLIPGRYFTTENAPPECLDWPLTADMAEHVQTYLDYVRGVWMFCDETWIERNEAIDPLLATLPDPTVGQGTSDAGGVDYAAATLHVSDLKFGRGVLVEVEENEQFRLYALGAYSALTHEQRMKIKTATYHVVQPRADHDDGPCRTWSEPMHELLLWAQRTFAPAAASAMRPGAPRLAGDHCKFCKAKGTCAEFRGVAIEKMPFTFEDIGNKVAMPVLPDQTALTPERVSEVYFALDQFEEWIKAFRAFVFAELEAGREVPGVALKRKRTNRNWMDEAMVAEFYDHAPSIFQEPKVLSPAQMEKLAKKHGMEFPEHLVVKSEGDLTLCAADDKGALSTPPIAANRFTFEELP